MTVMINELNITEYSNNAEFTCEKTTAYVSFHKYDNRINVCVLNATHRVFRGMGKFFYSIEEAKSAYKSGSMKAILDSAQAALAI
jgi:CRISPR/Cas system endoribonuclease Cas6 (RAMP superfamily)